MHVDVTEPHLEKIHFPWQEFEVVLGLQSVFSQRNLNIHSQVQAEKFLHDCGFNLEDPMQLKQFEHFFCESMFFIRHHLFTEVERTKFPVPSSLLRFEDPCNLLIFASQRTPRKRYLRLWCCAILKVMYVIANIHHSGKLTQLESAREQIFKKIRAILTNDTNSKNVVKFKDFSIKLNKIEWKEAKTRTSLILKLLQKHDTVTDDVFDYLGVRFIVQDTKDIPLLLKGLIATNIIIPHQVVAIRTRNSVLSIKNPKRILTFLKDLNSNGTVTPSELNTLATNVNWQLETPENIKKSNIFSSQHYKSVQCTVRHFVRTPNMASMVLNSMIEQFHKYTGIYKQEPWMESIVPKYSAHYFPIEIQIMDQESYEHAQFGLASHEQYKAQQLKSVREKILGTLLFFTAEKLAVQEF